VRVRHGCRQQILQLSDMLHLAEQIAAGMDYLASRRVVHGDLAARNVLVGAEARVKVSDLGLGRHTYPHDYHAPAAAAGAGAVKTPPLPVRWLPPESIFTAVVTSETDVWSFAVTLWEVCMRPSDQFRSGERGRRRKKQEINASKLYSPVGKCSERAKNGLQRKWYTCMT